MPPPFPHTATINTNGAPTVDLDTNNPVPGVSTAVETRCLLQQKSSEDIGGTSTVADWLGVFPLGTQLNTNSRVAGLGHEFVVVGAPATQESLMSGSSHVEAQLKYVSDLQE